MDNSIYVMLSRMKGVRNSLDVVANNIANSTTAGFKKDEMLFGEYLVHSNSRNIEDRQTSFAQDKMTWVDTEQGGLTSTGNPLDVAIQGGGFFGYELAEGGEAFGRDGNLMLNAEGFLVTSAGHAVLDVGGGPIAIPEDATGGITISSDGSITDGQGNEVAQIGVFDVPDIQDLQRIGSGMFMTENPAFVPVAMPSVAQGFTEGSNVQPIVEMTKMINIQRAYTHANKLVENSDELTKTMLQRLGRPV